MNTKRFDEAGIVLIFIVIITQLFQGLTEKSFYIIFSFIIVFLCLRGLIIESNGFTTWVSPQLLYLIFALVSNFIGIFNFWYRFDYSSHAPEIVKNIVVLYNMHFILIYFGTFFYNRIKNINIIDYINKYYEAPFENIENYRKLVIPTIILFIICSLAVWIIIFKGHYYPLDNIKNLLSGNILYLRDLALKVRGEISFGALSGTYIGQPYFNQIRIMIIPVIVLFWTVLAYLTRDRLIILLSIIGIIIESIFLTGLFERGTLLIFLIRLFLLIPLLYRPQQISRKKLVLFLSISLIIVIVSLTLVSLMLGRMKFSHNIISDFSGQIFATLQRFYNVNSLATFFGFKVVPEILPFQNGTIWTNTISDYLPGRDFGWSSIIYSYGPWGKQGNATQSLFAEMWANGGAPIIAIGSFLLGFFMQSFNVWMANQKTKDILRLIFFNIALFSISYTAVSHLFTGIDTGFIAAIITLWGLQTLNTIFSKLSFTYLPTSKQPL